MPLQQKILAALVGVLVLYLGIDYWIQSRIVFPKFLALECEQASTDLARCHHAIEREVEQLVTQAKDWGSWDDMHAYVLDKNQAFEADTLDDMAIANADLDVLTVIDPEGRFVFRRTRSPGGEEGAPLRLLAGDRLPEGHHLDRQRSGASVTSGLLMTEHGPLMLAAVPILPSTEKGTPRGTLVVGRYLDDGRVATIAQQSAVEFDIAPLERCDLTIESRYAVVQLLEDARLYIDGSQTDRLHAYSSMSDLHGAPVLLTHVVLSRNITARGAGAMQFAIGSLVASSVILLVLLFVLLQRIVLGPIASLTEHATLIGSTGDLTSRLEVGRNDEIGALANQFNAMVQKLSDSRSQLMALSREAGMADVAAGVMHNIGNVMTNVTVVAASLEKRVSASKLAGLSRAAAMLEDHRHDLPSFLANDPKGQKLPQYLVQLAGVWEQEQRQMLEEIDTLSGGLQHVAQILQAQHKYATGASAVEPTCLADLLNSAAEIVRASMDEHGVRLECSYEPVATVQVDRAKLLQVVVNLLTNAKDALTGTPRDKRQVWMSLATDSADRVQITVRDSGAGIAPENLTRIFADGFSTKSEGRGHGLHYCGLAAREMKGSLAVFSDGEGLGARFVLTIPKTLVHQPALA